MATHTFYRKANVSSAKAMESLSKRFSEESIISFERKAATAEEAAAAGANEGDLIYAATVRVAEFPPTDKGGEEGSDSDSDSGSSESEAPKGESDDGDSAPKSDSDSSDESSDSGDAAPAFDDKADGAGPEGAKPHHMKPEEQMVHLLQQILDALKGGGAPLPPPVKEKSPIGVGAFSKHIAGRESFTFVRQDVKADGLGHRALIREAMDMAPGYRVARLNVNEVEDTATLTMERI